MIYVWHPLTVRNGEDLLHERGIDITDVTVVTLRRRPSSCGQADLLR